MTPHNWRRLRQITQFLALALFLSLFVTTFRTTYPWWAKLFQRLDPLTTLAATLSGQALIAGFWLALLTVFATLVFGRVWCGWICPLGTVLEWLAPKRGKKRSKPRESQLQKPPDSWRIIKYVLLFTLLFAALLGNQSLLFLDPITIMTRTLAGAVWPAVTYAIYQMEAFLYQFEFLWGPLDAVHESVIYPTFQDTRAVFIQAVPVFLFFAAIVALNWWAERFWCRYLCPLGGLLGLLAKLALVRREVSQGCKACARCVQYCPTDTIDPDNSYRSDPAECTVCYDCLVGCPTNGVAFRWHTKWKPAKRHTYDPKRQEVIIALGAAVVGVSLAGVEPIVKHQPLTLLRPPGATLTDFETLCIRCGACIRSCSTQGLQTSLFEGGWQNVFTPRLVPRLGHCSYDCNVCGQVCPTGAIPELSLEHKQVTPMGLAWIDQNRCLPWAYNTPCIVCEEMCPVPDKAIELEEVEAFNDQGEWLTLQRPYVVRELCIGCGICENKCPLDGAAAIRVSVTTEEDTFLG